MALRKMVYYKNILNFGELSSKVKYVMPLRKMVFYKYSECSKSIKQVKYVMAL